MARVKQPPATPPSLEPVRAIPLLENLVREAEALRSEASASPNRQQWIKRGRDCCSRHWAADPRRYRPITALSVESTGHVIPWNRYVGKLYIQRAALQHGSLVTLTDPVLSVMACLQHLRIESRQGADEPFHVRVVGLPGLAPLRVPQSAHREDDAEAPDHAEREKRKKEEEASAGLDGVDDSRSPQVDGGHAGSKDPYDECDDVPRSPFREHQRSVQQDDHDGQNKEV